MTSDDLEALQRRLDRERRARHEAELIAERTTRDLYETVNQLRQSQAESDDRAALVTLLQRSAVAANEAADLEAAAQIVLDAVCAHTGWPLGHLYVADGQGLDPSSVWHLDDPERYAEFRCVTEGTPLRFGEGLPGRVLAKGKPDWITDVNRDSNFPRANLCVDSGVKAGFAFPVVAGNDVVAVLEFFSPEALEPNRSLLESMAHIGSQLGRVVERTRARAALQASEEQHRLVIETANDAFIAIDTNSIIIDWNRQAESTFGWTRSEAVGRSLTDTIIPEAHIAAHVHGVTRFVTTGEGPVLGRRMELTAVHSDGHEFPIELTVWAAQADGAVRFNAFVHDISERKAFEHRLEHQALHDPLTGLPNRALFLDRLAHALSRTQRQGRSVGVLFVDLDRFKSVNDSLGHEAGDRLLLGVAARVPAALRNGDTLARLGGDEFVILCEDLEGADGALKVAERVQRALSGPFTLPKGVVSITASIGIATAAAADVAPEQLLADADLAMYRAKERGRGLCELFDEEIRARLVERLASEKALRRAVEQDELLTYYQPIVELRGGNVVGVEALLRWHRPDTGLVPAAEFVPLAEETGLITPMGEGVMRDACTQLTTWSTGEDFLCAVNVSVHELEQQSFVENLARIVDAKAIAPGRIVLEVTESVMMHDARAMIRRLWELKELGFGLAIDDFGTGYSSLDRLRRMPVDRLKIDKSFIRDMGATPTGTPLVAAIIAMAHGLGLTVVAEGVETPFQFEALRRLGCDEAQGYLFGRPAPAGDIAKVVGHPTVATVALLEESGRLAAPQAVEAKLMNVVSEAMRGRGNVEYTTRSLLAELERLIGLDRTA